MNVGKCVLPFAPLSSKTFAPRTELRIVSNCIYRDETVDCTFIALVPYLLEKVLGYLADGFIVVVRTGRITP